MISKTIYNGRKYKVVFKMGRYTHRFNLVPDLILNTSKEFTYSSLILWAVELSWICFGAGIGLYRHLSDEDDLLF